MQIRDLRCVKCGTIRWNEPCKYGEYESCEECGSQMNITWEGGKPPATDIFGSAKYFDCTGGYHTSTREVDNVMRAEGFYAAGDLVGGARKDHTLKHTYMSGAGLSRRTSTGERTQPRT